LYGPIYVLLVTWVVLALLGVLVRDLGTPLVLMVVLDAVVLRSFRAVELFGGCMLAVLIAMLVLKDVLSSGSVPSLAYRLASAGTFVLAVVVYQLLVQRSVRRYE
jgi:hypothetical protein